VQISRRNEQAEDGKMNATCHRNACVLVGFLTRAMHDLLIVVLSSQRYRILHSARHATLAYVADIIDKGEEKRKQ
jgi:hypothetical protein